MYVSHLSCPKCSKTYESEALIQLCDLAFGITVPKALGDFLVLDAIYKTDGCAVAVDDDQILASGEMLASREGTFVCPEGAANLSAALKLRDEGWIQTDSINFSIIFARHAQAFGSRAATGHTSTHA